MPGISSFSARRMVMIIWPPVSGFSVFKVYHESSDSERNPHDLFRSAYRRLRHPHAVLPPKMRPEFFIGLSSSNTGSFSSAGLFCGSSGAVLSYSDRLILFRLDAAGRLLRSACHLQCPEDPGISPCGRSGILPGHPAAGRDPAGAGSAGTYAAP